MDESYQHVFSDQLLVGLPVGKAVCVGRNYLDHVRELNNPESRKLVLFMKPPSCLVSLHQPVLLPPYGGECHHELEIAVLIGARLRGADPADADAAVVGYALALDLTLREVQTELKQLGLPWELAKAFDRSLPISPFVPKRFLPRPQEIVFSLEVNGQLRQRGYTGDMIRGIMPMLATISRYFTLYPGDVVLTGTPAGVGPLQAGDQLLMTLQDHIRFETQVEREPAG
ncbi:MAG: fumarylacetoacetate hydrolase family protein [Magnetococcales bacterium]|nr:fumarylacetoacetate hydrolase family protein [Magnetococcales bacterium]